MSGIRRGVALQRDQRTRGPLHHVDAETQRPQRRVGIPAPGRDVEEGQPEAGAPDMPGLQRHVDGREFRPRVRQPSTERRCGCVLGRSRHDRLVVNPVDAPCRLSLLVREDRGRLVDERGPAALTRPANGQSTGPARDEEHGSSFKQPRLVAAARESCCGAREDEVGFHRTHRCRGDSTNTRQTLNEGA